jgi:outer membrane receptor protein involved in Fe transport
MTTLYSCFGRITRAKNRAIARALLGALASVSMSFSVAAQTQKTPASSGQATTNDESEEQPVVLSPFDVNASTNAGYGASTTASTSRMVQDYIDVAQTVNVVTSQFIEDYNINDTRGILEFVPNIQVGLPDNPYSTRIRGAIVTSAYIDGVAIPNNYVKLPVEFFDRVEVVKGPSSITFGLGQPGGLVNYISKFPQRKDATSVSFGVGLYDNYLARFDVQGVSAGDKKLSYRVTGFWDDGGYNRPNIFHSGAGAQMGARYDLNPTTRMDLLVAYSKTQYPHQQVQNDLWANYTEYAIINHLFLGNPNYSYLPGTKFSNGSIFGVSGTLPPPGSETPVFGTGKLDGVDSNSGPPGWDGDTEEDTRVVFIVQKDFADGHVHVRDSTNLNFTSSTIKSQSVNNVFSVPGSANGPHVGNVPTRPVNGELLVADVGPPRVWLTYGTTYQSGEARARQNELDVIATYTFLAVDWSTLIGGNIYATSSRGHYFGIPADNQDGSIAASLLYQTNNTPFYIDPHWTALGDSSSSNWGYGYFIQEEAKMFKGKLNLSAGWRIDYFTGDNHNFLNHTYTPGNWQNTGGSPRFAVTYKPWPWLSVYGLYTQHKDPAATSLKYFISSGTATPEILAAYPLDEIQTFQPGGITKEIGLKSSFLNGKLDASVAVFKEVTTGQLNPVVAYRINNADGTQTQVGILKVEGLDAHGIEVEIFGQPTPRLSFTANYGMIRGNFPAFANGTPNLLRPSDTISGHAKYDFGDLRGNGFYLMAGGKWLGPYIIWQEANFTQRYDSSQHLFDLGCGYSWTTGRYRHNINVNLNNIEDNLVVIGTVTPWTHEPMKSGMVTYKISF